MARIRTLKPEFFTSEDIAALPLRARLTFAGLWTYADDYGNAKAVNALIKAAVWPLDDDIGSAEVAEDLALLAAQGLISHYEADGRSYLSIVTWSKHQKVDRPSSKRHPEPSMGAREDDASPREKYTQEGEGEGDREQGGGDEPPSRFCINHPRGTPDNCRACGAARTALKAWERQQHSAPTYRPPRAAEAVECSEHAGYPLPCSRCAQEATEQEVA